MSLNRFEVIGRLTKDPETKQTESGTTVATISIAQNKTWKDAQGEKQEKSLFFNLTAFGKTAETLEKYITKGQQMFFACSIENYSFEDSEGTKRYGTRFTINEFEFLAKPANNSNDDQDDFPDEDIKPSAAKRVAQKAQEEINIEDIPF